MVVADAKNMPARRARAHEIESYVSSATMSRNAIDFM